MGKNKKVEPIRYLPSTVITLGHTIYVADTGLEEARGSARMALQEYREDLKQLPRGSLDREYRRELLQIAIGIASGKRRGKREYEDMVEREGEERNRMLERLNIGGKLTEYVINVGHIALFGVGGVSAARISLNYLQDKFLHINQTNFDSIETWISVLAFVLAGGAGEIIRHHTNSGRTEEINKKHDHDLERARKIYTDGIKQEYRIAVAKAKQSYRRCFREEPQEGAEVDEILKTLE